MQSLLNLVWFGLGNVNDRKGCGVALFKILILRWETMFTLMLMPRCRLQHYPRLRLTIGNKERRNLLCRKLSFGFFGRCRRCLTVMRRISLSPFSYECARWFRNPWYSYRRSESVLGRRVFGCPSLHTPLSRTTTTPNFSTVQDRAKKLQKNSHLLTNYS